MGRRKEANIIVHQLRTAVHSGRKLRELKRELKSYTATDQEEVLNDLDEMRQEFLANNQDELGKTLEELIEHVRLGLEDDRPRLVPKQF